MTQSECLNARHRSAPGASPKSVDPDQIQVTGTGTRVLSLNHLSEVVVASVNRLENGTWIMHMKEHKQAAAESRYLLLSMVRMIVMMILMMHKTYVRACQEQACIL